MLPCVVGGGPKTIWPFLKTLPLLCPRTSDKGVLEPGTLSPGTMREFSCPKTKDSHCDTRTPLLPTRASVGPDLYPLGGVPVFQVLPSPLPITQPSLFLLRVLTKIKQTTGLPGMATYTWAFLLLQLAKDLEF